jgi:hypothetical protein
MHARRIAPLASNPRRRENGAIDVNTPIFHLYQSNLNNIQAWTTAYYPLMSEAARFLLAYATTGSDGALHTVANAHETQWHVKDPVTDIVAMQALFPVVIAAAQILGLDATLVSQLQEALPTIPPLPRTDAATHSQLLTAPADAAGQDVFAISSQPTAALHNSENLELEAVWPYGLIGDASPDSDLGAGPTAHRQQPWSTAARTTIQRGRLALDGSVIAAR